MAESFPFRKIDKILEIVVEVGHREKFNELSYTGQYTHKLV